MKNLFNNPWFVAAIGAFAMIYLGLTVVKPLLNGDQTAVADSGDYEDFEDVDGRAVASGTRGVSVLARENISWLHDVDRDPFTGTSLAREVNLAGPLPKVASLFVGAGVQAAVINNRLVYVGDVVDHYRVTNIAAQHVQVSLAGRSYRLEPDV